MNFTGMINGHKNVSSVMFYPHYTIPSVSFIKYYDVV